MFANISMRLLGKTDDTSTLRSARDATLAVAAMVSWMVYDMRLFDKSAGEKDREAVSRGTDAEAGCNSDGRTDR